MDYALTEQQEILKEKDSRAGLALPGISRGIRWRWRQLYRPLCANRGNRTLPATRTIPIHDNWWPRNSGSRQRRTEKETAT